MWRKYNDEAVSAVTDISQIFDQDPSDRPPTPYFLVYVKDELRDQLVDPVCRDIPEQEEQQQQQQQQPQEPQQPQQPQQPQPDATDALMSDIVADYPMTSYDADGGGQGTTAASGEWYKADNSGKQMVW